MTPPSSFVTTTVAERGRLPVSLVRASCCNASGSAAIVHAARRFAGMLYADEHRAPVRRHEHARDLADVGTGQEAAVSRVSGSAASIWLLPKPA